MNLLKFGLLIFFNYQESINPFSLYKQSMAYKNVLKRSLFNSFNDIKKYDTMSKYRQIIKISFNTSNLFY